MCWADSRLWRGRRDRIRSPINASADLRTLQMATDDRWPVMQALGFLRAVCFDAFNCSTWWRDHTPGWSSLLDGMMVRAWSRNHALVSANSSAAWSVVKIPAGILGRSASLAA